MAADQPLRFLSVYFLRRGNQVPKIVTPGQAERDDVVDIEIASKGFARPGAQDSGGFFGSSLFSMGNT
jgi:hypothetical protein